MVDVKLTAAEAHQAARIDRAKVAATTDADIARQQVEDGEEAGAIYTDWAPDPKTLRSLLGLSQEAMAATLNIPLGTWRNWEQRRVALDPANRTLLRILWREPAAVMRALQPC